MRDLPEGWVETTLGEAMEICSGKTRPKQQGAYPVYGGNGILNYGDKFNQEGETIIVGRVGAYCGNVFYETQPFWLSDNALGVKAKNVSQEKFLYYKLVSMKLNNHAIGGAQPLLTQTLLKELEISFPPLPEQKAIADMLSSFDEKIELLREQNKTLETLAQTIFKEWFVHFNFPDPHVKPYRNNGGAMVASELGLIPQGWRVGKLGDVVDIFDSKRIPISSNERQKRQGIYPYYGATKAMDFIDDYIFDGTYLLMAEDGSVMDDKGYPFLQYVWGKFWVNNHTHILQGKNGFSTEALYVFLKRRKVASIVNGAVQLKINQKNLMSFDIFVPTDDILQEFNELLRAIFDALVKSPIRLNIFVTIRKRMHIMDSKPSS